MPSTSTRRTRLATAVLLVTALAGSGLTSASADDKDDLKDKRGQVNQDINQAEASLDESSDRLISTTKAYSAAKQKLSVARDTLARTQGQLRTARAYDLTMQNRLADAEQDLSNAKADLKSGRARVDSATEKAQQFLIDQASEGDPSLRALSSLLKGEDSGNFSVKMDYTSAVNEAQSATLNDLDASEVLLSVKRDQVQAARNRVAEERAAAARNLELKKKLERRAESNEASVEQLVGKAASARSDAEAAKKSDLRQLGQLEDERDRIGAMLRKIAERERREAQQQAQEEQQQQQNNGGSSDGNSGSNNGGSNNGGSNDSGSSDSGFQLGYPVSNAYITSSYGMRFHPILHYYKLHDGTDFGAGCGTPVHAAEDGTITSAYYNAGYGNRIIMSHGYHRGVSVATSYNHMTSFSVGVGQRVSKGQVIGYSGTTGYSTGCHMHFMVYVNGSTTDPMNWL